MRAPRTLGLALVAVVSREAGAQHRNHRRAEDRPDAATIRRCGQPLVESSSDALPRGGPVPIPGSATLRRFRWPPTSPCFREEQERQRARAIRAFQDSRIVILCWTNLRRMNPAVREASVRVTLTVNEAGRLVGLGLVNSPDPRFGACIRAGLARIPPITVGPPVEAVTTVNLTADE